MTDKIRCQNGIDYDECDNEVQSVGGYCSDCEEKLFEAFIKDYY